MLRMRHFLSVIMLPVLALGGLLPGAQATTGPQSPVAEQPPDPCADGPMWIRTADGPIVALHPECAPKDSQPLPPLEGALALEGPASTGGPDVFGYTFDDSSPLQWFDANAGTNTGLTATSASLTGPIALPFAFKFYENTYTAVYIHSGGLLGFNSSIYNSGSRIPTSGSPSDFIAAHSTYLALTAASRVTYLSGGAAPNRYFVSQWTAVGDGLPGNTFTFQIVLWETGHIWLQYQTMSIGSSGYYCGVAGIEDLQGSDGLQYPDNTTTCHSPGNRAGKSVRFTRPAPSARVGVYRPYEGQHIAASQTADFDILIRNTGELGADTYNLAVSTAGAWPVALFAQDGVTPLGDTNSDTIVDTGPIDQSSRTTIIARVTAPAGAAVGSANTAILTLASALNPAKTRTVDLQTAVPSAFAQASVDFSSYYDGQNLYLGRPEAQNNRSLGNTVVGYDPAILELADGSLIYGWSAARQIASSVWVYEMKVVLLDRFGRQISPVVTLTDGAAIGDASSVSESSLALAQAPNGQIGLIWTRSRYQYTGGQYLYNYNLMFAVFNASGGLAVAPINLTNNTGWLASGAVGHTGYSQPKIAATGDNRFVLAWERYAYVQPGGGCTSYCTVYDIFMAVHNTAGGQIVAPRQLTQDTAGWSESFESPALVALPNNRVLLAYRQASLSDIVFGIYDSSGGIVKAITNLSGDGATTWDYGDLDAELLSDGRIMVAWLADEQVRLATLDSAFNRVGGPTLVSNPMAPDANRSVALARDSSGRVVVTWGDYQMRDDLYYALVDGSANVVTPAMIFVTRSGSSDIETSYNGYGLTTLSSAIASGGDGSVAAATVLAGGAPGSGATVRFTYDNLGAAPLTGATLTATLDPALTYAGDDTGLSASITGDTVSWSLSDLAFLDVRTIALRVTLSASAVVGSRYPVTMALSWGGPDANPADNVASAQVMASHLLNLALIRR